VFFFWWGGGKVPVIPLTSKTANVFSAKGNLAFSSLGVLRPQNKLSRKTRKNQKRQTTNVLKVEAKEQQLLKNVNLSFKLDLNVPTKLQQTHVESLFKW